MKFRLCLAILFLVSSALTAEDVQAFSGIYIKADDSEYSYDDQDFRAEGNALVRYNDVTLTADLVTGNAGSGDFEATGNVTFTQGERVVKGGKFTYNYKTKLGHSTDSSATVDKVFFRGKEMDSTPEGYSLTGSTFTTCDREKPHYYMAARELIIHPGDKLTARGVKFVALGRTLLTLPNYTISLKQGEKKDLGLPSLGLGGKYGLFLAHNLGLSADPGLSGELALRLSTQQAFQGGIKLNQVAGKPIIFNVTHREPFYGGRKSDIMLSRLPEVAYRFYSDGTPMTGRRDESLYLSRSIIDPTIETDPGAPLLIGEVGLGHFKEEPSRVESTRLDLRAMALFHSFALGDMIVVPGVLGRLSHYGTGDDYSALGFRLAAARKLGPESFVSLTYVKHLIGGTTPFNFDVIEVPNELTGRFRFPVGNFALDLGARYNLQTGRMFDSSVSVSMPLHCIEPMLTWRNRFHEFSFGIGLVGF